jgi:predicted nucleic acid-binding protein
MRALLDINVLLTLLDADHIDHQRAQESISLSAAPGATPEHLVAI